MTRATPGRLACAAAVAAALAACGPTPPDRETGVDAGPAVCDAGPDHPAASSRSRLAQLGPGSRPPVRAGGYLYVVQSLANTVGRFDLESGTYDRDFIDLAPNPTCGRDESSPCPNPYGLAVDTDAGRAWITNWKNDTVAVADTGDGDRLRVVDDETFDAPQGIALGDRRAWVTNVAHRGGDEPFEPGTLALVERATGTVVDTVETVWKNPQYVRRIETPVGPRYVVVDSGSISVSGGASSPAGIEFWRPSDGLDPADRKSYELGVDRDANVGAPGRPLPTPDGRYLYFASATAPVLFKFDLRRRTWVRGTDDPIQLYDTDGLSLDVGAMGPRGLVYVAAFNEDALYVFDTSCDKRLAGPIEVGLAPNRQELTGVTPVPDDGVVDAYFSLANANWLGRTRFRFSRH